MTSPDVPDHPSSNPGEDAASESDHNEPAVSVIVPCRNEAPVIRDVVHSILSQQSPPGGFEVIVADGMSDDGTREILEEIAAEDDRLIIADNPRRITPSALNAGIEAARGDVIIRMDAHTQYAPDYILRCLDVLSETNADNVGGPWVAKGEGYISRAIAAAFQSPFAVGGAGSHDAQREGEVDSVYLGCWKKEAFEKFGLFDEEFIRNQDDELNLRILRGGGKIWQSPRIQSTYRPRDSLGGLFRQYRQYGYWKVRVIRKHKIPASIRHLVPAAFVTGTLTGWLGFLIHPWIGYAYLGILALYALMTLAFSFRASLKANDFSILPVLPLVFFLFHAGYGIGFLLGLFDALFRGNTTRKSMNQLTRTSSETKPENDSAKTPEMPESGTRDVP